MRRSLLEPQQAQLEPQQALQVQLELEQQLGAGAAGAAGMGLLLVLQQEQQQALLQGNGAAGAVRQLVLGCMAAAPSRIVNEWWQLDRCSVPMQQR